MKKQYTYFAVLSFSLLVCVLISSCKDDEANTIVFEKVDGADWTLPENQDAITSNVIITRAGIKGIFNIAQEDQYTNRESPSGTEWAFGTLSNHDQLTYADWESTIKAELGNFGVPDIVGMDMVVHLIQDDIYLDVKFLNWSVGDPNQDLGGFSYERSIP